MQRLCIFCGSSPHNHSRYYRAAQELGQLMAAEGIGLVYGGSDIGTMRVIADTVLQAGGEVIGVMPASLVDKEIAHRGLTELRVVKSLPERKALMVELADGFIALPGGIGTLDELFEVLAWALLDMHHKPCGLLNMHGYYQKLIEFLEHALHERFIKEEFRSLLVVADDPRTLLQRLRAFRPLQIKRWKDRDTTGSTQLPETNP